MAAILLFFPGTAWHLLVDVLGGLTLLLLLLPLMAAGVGVLAWQLIRRRSRTCANCGTTSFGSELCPACGDLLVIETPDQVQTDDLQGLDAANVTINVEAVDVEPSMEERPSA